MVALRGRLVLSGAPGLGPAVQPVDDRRQRIAFRNQPASLGGGETRAGCVQGAARGFATLFDVGALSLGPRQDTLRLLRCEPGGLRH